MREVGVRKVAEVAGFDVDWCDESREVTFAKVGFGTAIIKVGERSFRRISPSGVESLIQFEHDEANAINSNGRVYLFAAQLAKVLDMKYEEIPVNDSPETREHLLLTFEDR